MYNVKHRCCLNNNTNSNNLFISYYPPHIIGSSSRSCISYFNVIWNNHDPTPTANKEQKISWYLKMIMATFNDNNVTPYIDFIHIGEWESIYGTLAQNLAYEFHIFPKFQWKLEPSLWLYSKIQQHILPPKIQILLAYNNRDFVWL